MSDVKDNQGSTSGTEGRTLSRARRQALSQGGKAGLGQTQNAKPAVRGHVRPPVPARGTSPAPIQARVESAVRPATPSPVSSSPTNSSPVKAASDNRSNERPNTEDCAGPTANPSR